MKKIAVFILVASFLVGVEANAFQCPKKLSEAEYKSMFKQHLSLGGDLEGFLAYVGWQNFKEDSKYQFPKGGMTNSTPVDRHIMLSTTDKGRSCTSYVCTYESDQKNDLKPGTTGQVSVHYVPRECIKNPKMTRE